jgi:uncharacterized repeat protein (TIGR01451 family)
VWGNQLPSLPGAPPARDLAFLPRDFVLAGARLTLAAAGGGDEPAPATSGDSNNNAASDTNNANEQVTVMQVADLALTKQVSPTHQMEGFDVTYTFILHNNGPSPATNVTVTDPFSGVTVVGPNTPSQGTFDPGTGVWSVGTLAPEVGATLTVTARVDVLGPIASTAHARADQFDPDLSNNTSGTLLIGLSNYSSEADKYDFARAGGQAREEEASDGRPEVEAIDDFFTLAGKDTDLLDPLGGVSGLLTLSLLATAAAVVASTGLQPTTRPSKRRRRR